MSSRPSRSSSIPIPRSTSASSARDIESLISIPFATSGGHQPTSPSTSRPLREPRRISVTDGSRATVSNTHGVSTSPIRSTARTTSIVSSIPGRGPSRTRFEPRVVRQSTSDAPSADAELPPHPSTSPSYIRRASMTSLRSSGPQKPVIPQHVVSRTTSTPFPRPGYLDHSSLRHLLHTEIPVQPIPSRRADPSASSRNQSYANAMSTSSDDDDSGTASPGPTNGVSQERSFKLPTRWSDQDRHPNLSVIQEGRDLTYQGPSLNGEKEAASARTSYPIPPACGIFYYEIEILGREQKSRISVGFAGKSARYAKLPGYEPQSWGYYGDDGSALSADRGSSQFGQPFGTGNVIGCGIDFSTNKVFFTKNAVLIGSVFENVGRNHDIYPTVGLQHSGDSIRANFGHEPFKFDIDYHVQQQRNTTWNKILSTPLDRSIVRGHNRRTGVGSIASITNDIGIQPPLTDGESKEVLDQLVMSYLVHHGYAKSARAFERQSKGSDREGSSGGRVDGEDHVMDTGSNNNAVESDIESRTGIVNSVHAGDMDSAINSLRSHYPTVLEADKQLMLFKLRFRKFVELILATAELKKKMKATKERELVPPVKEESPTQDWMDEEMSMDVDDDAPPAPAPLMTYRSLSTESSRSGHHKELRPDVQEINGQYEAALNEAISYGQALSSDYHSASRPELQQLFKRTFGIVAWEDPLEPGGPMADIAGQESRNALAHEINQAILKSQGRPAQPALETLYRHTSSCVTQVGIMGMGAAAFADMSREFL